MALPLHELFKDRDVWEFWRETGVFSEAIPRICSHVETLIQRYGALYGLVVWLGTDGKLYMVSSRNLGLAFRLIPLRLLKQGLRPYVNEIPGHGRHWIDVHKLKNIYGRGSQDTRGNSKGYYNKKAAFSQLQKRLADSDALPVLAVVYMGNKYLSICHPQKDTAMQNLMDKVMYYYQSLSTEGSVHKIKPNFSFLPPSWQIDSTQGPKRAQNKVSGTNITKKKPKTGGDQHLEDEPREEESEPTSDSYASSFDDDAEVLYPNAWISKIAKSIQIDYPYRSEVKRGVMERLLFGFSRDKEGTPLGPLQPRIPISIKCKCGLAYNRRGFKETDPVTVYMRPPHCAQSLPCMVLKCQRGEPECTLHYTGLEDGLWRASKTVAVELDLLVRCAKDSVRFEGQSLTTQRDNISEMYDMVSEKIPSVSFLEASVFREAVYGISSCLQYD